MTLSKRRPGLVYPVAGVWHYVGSGGGEPAFQNSWANGSSGSTKLAFRIREAGVVDIHGNITGGVSGTVVFTLPAKYRPSTATTATATTNTYDSCQVNISTAGEVTVLFNVGTKPSLAFQLFLTPPDVVP